MRALAALCTLLQAAVPAAAALADARLDAAPVGPVHVESKSTSACAMVHPDNCALCQFLAAPSLAPPPADRLPDPPARIVTTAARLTARPVARRARRLARAPPVLA